MWRDTKLLAAKNLICFSAVTAVSWTLLLHIRWLYTHAVRVLLRVVWWVFASTASVPGITENLLIQPAHVLALWIRQGKVSSEEIVAAYVNRIQEVNSILNAVVDERFSQALQEAREVDQQLSVCSEEDKRKLALDQPLLGVPFTTKESVEVEGLSHTGGLVCRKNVKGTKNACAVQRLCEAGGIPLCVTNVPELGLWWETSNCIYGTTSSPFHSSRTSGGSSGGEAALLSACGTPLCIGTDVGGSIRIPSFCCGTFGHKPTTGWVPLDGAGLFEDKLKKGRALVCGPIARSVADLILALQIMASDSARGLHSKVKDTSLSSLKIWWADDLGSPCVSPVDPRLRELLQKVVHRLQCTYKMQAQKWMLDLSASVNLFRNKLGDDYRGEPPITADMTNRKGNASLVWEWLMWICMQQRHTFPILSYAAPIFGFTGSSKVADSKIPLWKKTQQNFMEVLGNNGVLIMPTIPIVAPYHHEPIFNPFDFVNCSIFNAVEFPVTQVPLGRTDDGWPIGLQVVATPGNDHLSLAVAAALEELYGGWVAPCDVNIRLPDAEKL